MHKPEQEQEPSLARVRVQGRRVLVHVRPAAPFGLRAGLLEATAVADAGPS